MDILTRSIYPIFRKRLKALGEYEKHSDSIQENQLRFLLEKAKNTEFGRKYDFGGISSYAQFKERVPLHTYDDIKPYIERMMKGEKNILWPEDVKWFAKSSGTTSDKSKFIPVTKDILNKCHYKGGFDTVALYLGSTPNSKLFKGKSLILGGSFDKTLQLGDAKCGDLSAILIQNINPLVNCIRVPSKDVMLMAEWESKIKSIVKATVNADVCNLSGVPSWMLVLIKAVINEARVSYLTDVWPNLEVFFHGGISFIPYREQYKRLIPSDRMKYMETYNASEGFFGIQSDNSIHDLLLMCDYGVFFEFIPLEDLGLDNPRCLSLAETEVGENYAMVISTAGGLWRYMIGDTVRFTSKVPHKFIISGRTKNYINAFGEELMVDNAEQAISDVCKQTGAQIDNYMAAPLFMLNQAKGRHQWLVEFASKPNVSIKEFATLLDKRLQELNSDYEAKRYKEISLQPLEIIEAKNGVFYEWLKRNNKLGGQHKIPRLCNDRENIEKLLSINNEL